MEKSPDRANKLFTSRMQANLLLVFCIITLMLVGLMGRLIYIMQTKGDKYAKQVLSRETYVSSVLPYKRGDILDRNGTVLARSELRYKLIIDPKRLIEYENYIVTTMTALKNSFSIENETIRKILEEKPESRYTIILKNLKYDVVKPFKELMKEDDTIVGVWFEEEYVRSYPYNTLASDVIGFTSTDNTGYFGIEEYYNDELNGTNGREYGYFNSDLNIERIIKKAENGNSIVSTIDVNAQRIIQKHITQFNTDYGSREDSEGLGVSVLVMDPNNGEIIAMASKQEYDLNSPRDLSGLYSEAELSAMTDEQKMDALNILWRNDVISFGFEPGSTFKPITISAGLEENSIKDGDTFFCDGFETFPGLPKPIYCSHRSGHGLQTLEEAVMNSCNDALMQIVAKEGRGIFSSYQRNFGYGKKTGIDLPGEQAGIIIAEDDMKAVDLAVSSFGQTFTTTMIQMAAAYSSIVNGGYYYQPHVMKRIVNDSGATVREFDKLLVRQTVSEKTSELLQRYLYQTVESGTAKDAKVEGYSIGGKTGTAQKFPRDAKTYIVSFLGQVPAVNPEIVIYVVIDEPQNVEKQADSSLATKLASRIMKELLPALGIYPEGEIDYLLTPPEATPGVSNDTQTQTTPDGAVQGDGTTGNAAQDTHSQAQQEDDTAANQTQEPSGTTEDTATSDDNPDNTSASGNNEEGSDTLEDPENAVNPNNQAEPSTQNDSGDSEQSGDGSESNSVNTQSEEDEFNPDALE